MWSGSLVHLWRAVHSACNLPVLPFSWRRADLMLSSTGFWNGINNYIKTLASISFWGIASIISYLLEEKWQQVRRQQRVCVRRRVQMFLDEPDLAWPSRVPGYVSSPAPFASWPPHWVAEFACRTPTVPALYRVAAVLPPLALSEQDNNEQLRIFVWDRSINFLSRE